MLDMYTRGSTTVSISVIKPCKEFPKGGTYDRLTKLLVHKTETWDSVISRLLDHYDTTQVNIEIVKVK